MRENGKKVQKRTSKVYGTWPRSHVQLACQMDEKREYDGSDMWKDNSWEFPKTEEKH